MDKKPYIDGDLIKSDEIIVQDEETLNLYSMRFKDWKDLEKSNETRQMD